MTHGIGVAALRPVDAGIPTTGSRAYLAPRTTKDGDPKRHNGIDMLAPSKRVKGKRVRAKVRSVSKGVVTHAGESGVGFRGYGPQHVVVKTDAGVWLLYAHLAHVVVRPGDSTTIGTPLGTVDADIGHLHFEVSPRPYPQRQGQERLDPVAYLSGENTATAPSRPQRPPENRKPRPDPPRPGRTRRGRDEPETSLWGVFGIVVTSLLVLALKMLAGKATR